MKILKGLSEEYNVLEINGQRLMNYQTTYFDTTANRMYLKHHNQRVNRHKVRKRNYASTGSSFLEIKLKNNKKRTIKNRVACHFNTSGFTSDETEFIYGITGMRASTLNFTVANEFQRFTLVHKNNLERCTVDINPRFFNRENEIKLDGLVILELKRGRNLKSSPVVKLLKKYGIRQRGMSKHCTARALLEPDLKQNRFKQRLKFLVKNILITNHEHFKYSKQQHVEP